MDSDSTIVNIREGLESDCDKIMELIKDLAVYEGMSDQVKINAEDLRKGAFHTSPPLVYILVAELTPSALSSDESDSEMKKIVGYALYYNTYSTWKGKALHLEDLFVCPEWRFKGIGQKFLSHLSKIAKKGGFCRISFECIDWNEPAMKFYRKFGAEDVTVKDHWLSYRFVHSTLKKIVTEIP